MSARRGTNTSTSTTNKMRQATTDLDDDWETDPDFERRMDEIDQRWGSKRTVGSINMTKLIDEVHNDHKSIMRDRFLHPSQASIDKHSTSTSTSKKIITTSSSSTTSSSAAPNSTKEPFEIPPTIRGPSINDMKKTLFERSGYEKETVRPATASSTTTTKPAYERDTDFKNRLNRFNQGDVDNPASSFKTKTYETNTKSHRILRDDIVPPSSTSNGKLASSINNNNNINSTCGKTSASPTSSSAYSEAQKRAREIHHEIEDEVPKAFRTIQAKIDAYQEELKELEKAMAEKAHLKEKLKKFGQSSSTMNDNCNKNIEYVDSEPRKYASSGLSAGANRDANNIQSMREKFNNLMREDEDEFKRRTEARRKQFFDEIKNQVHETRRGLDGFDDPMMDEEFEDMKRKFMERNREHLSPPSGSRSKHSTPSPTAGNTSAGSGLGSGIHGSHSSLGGAPKVYTKRETHREEVVSRLVKENDKVIENETKRNVQHSSSCHGSSDEDELEPSVKIPINVATGKQSPMRTINSQSPRNQSPLLSSQSPQHQYQQQQSRNEQMQSPSRRTPDRNPSPVVLKSPTSKANTAGLMARTLYDYDAAEDDELSFDVDELITNIEKIDVGWYRGVITSKDGSKRDGLFPANYVKLLNDDGEY